MKRIMRYVKGTLVHGLYFARQRQPVHLSAYSDADWAGCSNSCRSTSGYLEYLGSNLISWYVFQEAAHYNTFKCGVRQLLSCPCMCKNYSAWLSTL